MVWATVGALLPTLLCFGLAAWGGNLSELLRHNFAGAAQLSVADPYKEFRPIVARHLLLRDTGFVLLSVFAVTWALRQGAGASRSTRYVLLSAVWGAATFFLTPGPFHYYLLSVLPMFVVLNAGYLAQRGIWPARSLAWMGIASLFVGPPAIRLWQFLRPTNAIQIEVVRVASALSQPGTPVFDGAGLLIRRPDAYPFHWVLWIPELQRYRRGELPPIPAAVRAGGAKLVLLSYRLDGLPTRDLKELLRQFPRLWGPICVPGFDSGPAGKAPLGPIPFELWYEGDYEIQPASARIDGEDGAARVANSTASPLIHLKAGIHEARLPSGENRLILRDAAYRSLMPLPPQPDDWRVIGRYGYRF
ncbi:MAG: hypothetical protein ABI639_04925 [Thermoanaerobaculia bacterium]